MLELFIVSVCLVVAIYHIIMLPFKLSIHKQERKVLKAKRKVIDCKLRILQQQLNQGEKHVR